MYSITVDAKALVCSKADANAASPVLMSLVNKRCAGARAPPPHAHGPDPRLIVAQVHCRR